MRDRMRRLVATRQWHTTPTPAAQTAQERRTSMDFIGFDLSKVASQICIVTQDGELLEHRIKTKRKWPCARPSSAPAPGTSR